MNLREQFLVRCCFYLYLVITSLPCLKAVYCSLEYITKKHFLFYKRNLNMPHICVWGYISVQCSGDSYAVLPFEQEIISISFFWVFDNAFCYLYMKRLPSAEINPHVQPSATSSCAISTSSTGLEWDEESDHFTGCKKVCLLPLSIQLWLYETSYEVPRPGQSFSTYVFRT